MIQPGLAPTSPTTTVTDVLEVHELHIAASTPSDPLQLVSDVSFSAARGEILGVVGESGSGKSLSALACMGLLPRGVEVTAGRIQIAGFDISAADESSLRALRGPTVSMVFQDPMSSLDPCFRIGRQMVEAIREHRDMSTSVARKLAVDFLGHVGVPEPARRFEAFPHELSGGLRQRAMIATALLLEPVVLLADEPTTALDVTTQASILELMQRLRDEMGMTVVWISHDLAVISQLADRVAVMYAGEIVECGTTAEVFTDSRHHYTEGLVRCAQAGERGQPFATIAGNVPDPSHWSAGCRFADRCARADDDCALHPRLWPGADEAEGGPLFRCHHPIEVASR